MRAVFGVMQGQDTQEKKKKKKKKNPLPLSGRSGTPICLLTLPNYFSFQ